jgi:GTPase
MATKAKPGDVTGRKREELAAQHAEQIQARAEEMSLATAEAAVKLETEVIDATKPHQKTVVVDAVTKVASGKDTVVIRVVENIESMTFGAGKHYSFKAGQKYEVTRAVANHLAAKGYLAHTF